MKQLSVEPEMKLKRIPDVVVAEVNGETVMMHIDKGTYFALTGSGGHIWAALEKPMTLPEITGFVEREYDVSEVKDLDTMVAEFVGKLLEQELVHPDD